MAAATANILSVGPFSTLNRAVENGSRARWIGRSESRKRRVKTRSKQANQAKARLFNDKFLGENTISYTPHQF